MPDIHNQVWVTSALTEEDFKKALVLCFSLRRVYTFRKIALLVSREVPENLKKAADRAFDFLINVDETRNSISLERKDFAKLYSLDALRAFDTCVYLSPSMMAVQNCDSIFAEHPHEPMRLLENARDTSVFRFKPSVECFEAIRTSLENNCYGNLGAALEAWVNANSLGHHSLDEKYHKGIQQGNAFLGLEPKIGLVNLLDYPTESSVSEWGEMGILGKLLGMHWLKIQQQDVIPLLSSPQYPVVAVSQAVTRYKAQEPIAIVGMSCRYPGANTIQEFWDLLFNAQDGTGLAPEFRWKGDQCYKGHPDMYRKTNAGFLKVPVDEFDATFFGLSPKEVVFMDPQHRIIHELVWESLEHAGIDPHSLYGSSGSVFFGNWLNDYRNVLISAGISEDFFRNYMGNSIGAAAARISFLLGLTGPCIATESGCSAAMVAVHLACNSLRKGETSMALACGVNLLLDPFTKEFMPMIASADGHCKTFSEDANGFARSEGAGVLVLKRLSDAMKDGDRIWGLIRGSAISQEGKSKSLGTPTMPTETLAMNQAFQDARVAPEEVTYVEAHGTGTKVGDPVEMAAIAKAYHTSARKEPLIVGSVKTNVGHTESCSGITGIMKVVLAMQHEIIPAHLNFSKLNPAITLESVPAVIPLQQMEWKKVPGKPRVAGVSSFGITGTDAHVIMEEPPQTVEKALSVSKEMERPVHILKISAKMPEAMETLLEKYKVALKTTDHVVGDIAYTANTGRANFPLRTAVLGKSTEDLAKAIESRSFIQEEANPDNLGQICFLFTGQGSQYPGMARTLYETSPVFRMHFDYCANILQNQYNADIRKVLWDEKGEEDIIRTIYSQTSIFCVEYALLKLWESWGVKPDYVLGHSLGEFAAAVCAGILTVEDAIMLVAVRSKLIDGLPGGKMLVIKADQHQVEKGMHAFAAVNKDKLLDYAAVNSNEQTVVAGDSEVVLQFAECCKNNKIKCSILGATHAFHSKHMDPILDAYRNAAKNVKKGSLNCCEYISGVKGDLLSADVIDANYWVDHTREKVNFLNASKTAVELGCKTFIEIGPQPVLSALTMMNNLAPITCLPSLKRNADEWSTILSSLAKLYMKGVHIDWKGFDQFYQRQKVELPSYPFMGKKFWPEINQCTGNAIHPLVGTPIPNASSSKLFQSGVNLKSYEYIKDHAIGETAVMPGAGYLEMCLAAGLDAVDSKPSRPFKVECLNIQAPLGLEEGKTVQLQTVVHHKTCKNENEWSGIEIQIYHRVDTEIKERWLQHASGIFSPLPSPEDQQISFDKNAFMDTISHPPVPEKFYDKLASVGLKFGPAFQSLEKTWREKNSLIAQVKVPLETEGENGGQGAKYIVHPVVLDAMIQAIFCFKLVTKLRKKLYVPVKIGKFVWLSHSPAESDTRYVYAYNHATDERNDDPEFTQNCTALLLDAEGTVLAAMSNCEFVATLDKTVDSLLKQQACLLPEMWDVSWRAQRGPAQYAHDHKTCQNVIVYDQEFCTNLSREVNVFSPELEEMDANIKKLTFLHMLRCFYQCGFQPTLNSTFTQAQIMGDFKIQKQFTRFFRCILCVLEEEGILKNLDDDKWEVVSRCPPLDVVEEQLNSKAFTEELMSQFQCTSLLVKLGDNMKAILTGKEPALPILFPESGPSKRWCSVDDFYVEYSKHYPSFGVVGKVQRLPLSQCKAAHDAHEEKFLLRICEIGAGTGVMTAVLLNLLEELGIDYEYYYTDISIAFFMGAEKKFQKYLDKMVFKKLDLEDDPLVQGFTPAYFDMVVSLEVVHATRSLRETLNHINMILKPGGRFEMGEQITISRLMVSIFGYLDGFWRFEDTDIRKHYCSLTADGWVKTLRSSGFETEGIFPSSKNRHAFFSTRKCSNISTVLQNQKVEYPSREKSGRNTWIVFHETSSLTSTSLITHLHTLTNRKLVVVTPANGFTSFQTGWPHFEVNPDSEQDYVHAISSIEQNKDIFIEGVLYCWSLNKSHSSQVKILKPFLYLAKAVLKLKRSAGVKLLALTQGAAPVEENDMSHYHTSTLVGFIDSLKNERMDLCCRAVDVGPLEKEDLSLFYELWNGRKEPQVAYGGASCYVHKTSKVKPALSDLPLPQGVDRYCLILPESKAIADLEFGQLESFVLNEKDIEIQVKAAALNFRDVLSVLKPSEDFKDSNSVGFDFAGIIKRVGAKVTKWTVGDNVFGMNLRRNALPSHVKLEEDDVVAIPNDMTFAEASTLTAVVTTSILCLLDVAQIKSTDTVLIHAASGGVGLSAIQLCKHVGATVIATAGSKRKQNYLKNLGIQHVFHSRNTNYEQEIQRVTNGRGVDVVLNSLTSEGFKEASLNCCALNARFVEMSKLNIWTTEQVQKRRPDVEYTTVDLTECSLSEWRRLLTSMEKLVKEKVIQSIPYVRFDGVHIREALQYLQQARHVGKVVCMLPEVRQQQVYTPMFHENATYLITGGLGGIGFLLCEWMLEKGARYIVLASRKKASEQRQQQIDSLNRNYQAHVIAVQLDVAKFEDCRDLLKDRIPIEFGYPVLRGVMHAAGTLQDGLVENQRWENFEITFSSKVNGTANLHELTKDNSLMEHFVLFSSVAGMFGSPGQSNHAAGNKFEDICAYYRHSIGLPATSVNWGQWGETGVATEMDYPGLRPISNAQGIAALEYAMKAQRTQTAVFNMDSFGMFSTLFPNVSVYLDENVWKVRNTDSEAATRPEAFWEQYEKLENPDEKDALLQETVKVITRQVLKMDPSDPINPTANLQEMGVDSLMFVEIKNALQTILGNRATLTSSVLQNCDTVVSYATTLLQVIEGLEVEEEKPLTQEQIIELLKEDCHLLENIRPNPEQKKVRVQDISVVLLTGMTGTLGSFVLRELCQQPQISKIYCLIRPKKGKSAEERLCKVLKEGDLLEDVDMSRICCVEGDVAATNLGVESTLWAELCKDVDAVFHCAASVSHMDLYVKRNSDKDMRAVNVEGTRRILQFACDGDKLKQVYCASSLLGATSLASDETLAEEWPVFEEFLKHGVSTFAYPNTKFAGDMLMMEGVKRGIPAKVFRFPYIVGDSTTGSFILDQNHLMLRYFFILKKRVMPGGELPIVVLPVDICASASVKIMLCPEATDPVYHVSNTPVDLDQEFVRVAKQLGVDLETIDYSEFSKKLIEATAEDSPYVIFQDFYKSGQNIISNFPILQQWVTDGKKNKDYFTSKKISKFLPEFGNTSGTAMDHIYRDMLYAESQGWLKKYAS